MDEKIDDIGMSKEEFERQYVTATRRGEEKFARAPKALSAKYNKKNKRLVIELKNGATFMIPTDLIQGLRSASPEDIAEVELWLEGMYLHWEKLDVDFEVSSLINGVFGTPKWMAELNSHTENKPRKRVA